MLRLKLLGPFELLGSDGPIGLASGKLAALLAYLALARGPVPRDEIATLLWGSHFDEQAKQNLRQALVRLRKAVGEDALIATDRTIQLAPAALQCDAAALGDLVQDGSMEALQSAAGLLGGEFLAGLDVKQEGFDAWLSHERQRMANLAGDCLVRLAALKLDLGNWEDVLRLAERCIRLDYFREDAHRLLLQALAGLGRRAEAVRHFQGLTERLKQDLGTGPEAATADLLARLNSAATPASKPIDRGHQPSIAVLPFASLSSDPEHEFFADGITEDLITELAKFHSLFVISRNSTFAFKGQTASARDISQRLGARYIVEGSVRRAGERLRISAKLIDAGEDRNLWAEHYDRALADIFAVQDEVVQAIVAALEPQLFSRERSRALRKPPDNLDAWECYQRGLWHVFRYRRDERDLTVGLFERAIGLDPGFASAHAGLAYALYLHILLGSSPNLEGDRLRALDEAKMAVSLDEFDPFAQVALARCHMVGGNPEAALAASEKAIRISPSLALAHFGRGHSLWHLGRPREAVTALDEAIRLSPNDPVMSAFMASKAIALALAGELDEAVSWSRRSQEYHQPAVFTHIGEVCALGLAGRDGEAADAIRRARLTMDDLSVSHLSRVFPITDIATAKRFLKGLRLAGLPE